MSQPNPPQALQGFMDDNALTLEGYASTVDYLLEHIPALVHPESVRTYAQMRHDPMITAILQAYNGPIERAHWALDPAGCRDEVVERVADDLGLPILGWGDTEDPNDPGAKVQRPTGARRRGFTWADHLRVAGLDRVYGHMFFEQAWAEQDAAWRLAVVQERMPQTIAALHLNRDGTLGWVEQGAISSASPIKLTTADHRLVYYSRQREGSNYFGQSLIRPCYSPWLIKGQVMRVHATAIRKWGMGVPYIEDQPNATPQQSADNARWVQRLRASDNVGGTVPSGAKLQFAALSGNVPDALAFLNFLNQEMARATLTMLLTMAGAERGNRSLGETVMDLLIMSQQADAEFHADEGTRQIVVPLVDANYGPDEPAPKIHVGQVGADVEVTAQDIYWLTAYSGLKPDRPAREWIRERFGMPAEDPTDPVFATASADAPAQPDPNAPTPTPPSGGQ